MPAIPPADADPSPDDDAPSPAKPAPRRRRRFLLVARILLALLTLGLVFHGLENHRGRSAWEAESQRLQNKDLPLTLREALARAAAARDPVGSNFCRLPMMAALRQFDHAADGSLQFLHPELVQQFDSLQLPLQPGDPPHFGAIGLQTPADLVGWEQWLDGRSPSITERSPSPTASDPTRASEEATAASRILEALSPTDWVYQSLVHAARESGHAAFPPYLDGDESLQQLIDLDLPEVARLLHVGDAVQLRGLAALGLAEPDADAALDAWRVLQRLGDALRSGPALIHSVNANHLDEACLNLIWDGLRRDAWTPEHLGQLRQGLSRIKPRQHLRHTLEVELNATVLLGCDYFKQHRGRLAALLGGNHRFDPSRGPNLPSSAFWHVVVPRGWLDQNKANSARLLVDYGIDPLAEHRLPPPLDSSTLARTPYRFYADLAVVGHLHAVHFAIDGATWIRLAETAIAIRQFEQRHQHPTESLRELIADRWLEQLPVDPWSPSAEPLAYTPPVDHRHSQPDANHHADPVWRLHSVGPDPDRDPTATHRPEWVGQARR